VWIIVFLACLAFIVQNFSGGNDKLNISKREQDKKVSSKINDLGSIAASDYYSHTHDGSEHTHKKHSGIGTGSSASVLMERDSAISRVVSDAIRKKLKTELNDPTLIALGVLASSHNENFLKVAEEASEVEPMVAVAFATKLGEHSERLKATEALITLEPFNSIGYLSKADVLFRNGQREEALACLSEIKEEMYFRDYSEDVQNTQSELLKSSRLDVVGAGLLNEFNPMTNASVKMLNGVSQMLFKSLSDDDAVVESASIMLEVLDSYEQEIIESANSSSVMGLLTLRENTLRRLPEGFALIDGKSIQEEANQIAQRKVAIDKNNRLVIEKLETLPYEVAEDYYTIYLNEGQSNAEKWLLGE